MTTQITLFPGSAQQTTVNLVALPSRPGLKSVEFTIFDAVASASSPFTGQTQTQIRPGADSISVRCTLPPMKAPYAAQWKAWMMAMRGMANAVQLGDPDAQRTHGAYSANIGVPVCTTTGNQNLPMAQQIFTRGWKPNQPRVLVPGDAFQLGYRLHWVLDTVNTDVSGAAHFGIWPSLRELPPDGTPLNFKAPKGLFRFAKNDRSWSRRVGEITDISFDLVEYR